ncbi:MAG: DUF748 domain-containing protein [Pseudomonadales bacterium]|nr:DUF748 domain-containing protein [Pseudomonadales bacterium]
MRKGSLVLGSVLLVLVVLVAATPFIVRWQAETLLSEQFQVPASIADVVINPVDGLIAVKGVMAGDALALDEVRAELDIYSLLSDQIVVRRLLITGLKLSLDLQPDAVQVGKLRVPLQTDENAQADAEPSPGWYVEVLNLQDVLINAGYLRDPAQPDSHRQHQLSLQSLQLGRLNNDLSQQMPVSLTALIDGAEVGLDGSLQTVPSMHFEGRLQLAADVSEFADYLPLAIESRVSADQQIQLTLAGPQLDIQTEGQLTLVNNRVQLAELSPLLTGPLTLGSADWQGSVRLQLLADQLQSLALTGQLKTSDFAAMLTEPVTLSAMDYNGQVTLTNSGAENNLSVQGDLNLQKLTAGETGSAGSFSAKQLNIQIAGGQLLSVLVDHLMLTHLDLHIERQANGQWSGLPQSAAEISEADNQASATGSDSDADAPKADNLPVFAVDRLDIDGRVSFTDKSVRPVADIAFEDLVVAIERLERGATQSISIGARHHESSTSARVELTGEGNFLDQPANGELSLMLQQFELFEVSSYLGDGIKSGQLTLDTGVVITDDKIKAENRVRVKGLDIDSGLAKTANTSDLSISVALDLLKDGDDRIDLKVPIEADLQNFSVDTSHIVQTALGNAARKAAFAYAQYALQPFGSLMLLKNVAEAAAKPRFQPMVFTAGSTVPGDEVQAYADKLVQLMLDRPGLALTLCGVATGEDRQFLMDQAAELARSQAAPSDEQLSAQIASQQPASQQQPSQQEGAQDPPSAPDYDEALLDIAQARGTAVRALLLTGGIAEQRLYACRPTIATGDESPSVTIDL